MKRLKIIIALVVLVLCGCNNPATDNDKKDLQANKNLYISIDESFKPVMVEQLKVFESSFPDTKIIAEYKPEADCIRDLEKDSTKIIIISRELSRQETAFFNSKIEFKPEFARIAHDAVAVLINTENKDSTFTVQQLQEMLSENGNDKYRIAIDGNTATSTVRYLKDSLLKGGSFGKNITGAKNSEDLVRYISTTPNAVGFVGISWITNPQNAEQERLLLKVKMALIECKNCDKDTYAKPSQQTITFNQYPLVRGLYYVLKENYAGIGSRFINFLTTERGQLIFRRALLVPTKMNFDRRRTDITDSK